MGQVIYQVDSFTDRLFSGNPAGVCVLDGARDKAWMQDVAAEMNLSETAFLHPEGDGFRLRWFTPTTEVDLCGHATLASAHLLWESGRLRPEEPARFQSASGPLTAIRKGAWIDLDFPAEPAEDAAAPAGLAEALGAGPKYVGRNRFAHLVELGSESEVRNLKPDFGRLAAATDCVIVTSLADPEEFDFVSRFFGPGVGIPEDPVTGAAHCCLGPFWGARLGRSEFTAYQASSRGGVVRVRLEGSRVHLGGRAVTVLRGELASP